MNAKNAKKPLAKITRNRSGRPANLDAVLKRLGHARTRAVRAQRQALAQLNRRVAPLGLRVVAKSA